jgi:hypothetical protein
MPAPPELAEAGGPEEPEEEEEDVDVQQLDPPCGAAEPDPLGAVEPPGPPWFAEVPHPLVPAVPAALALDAPVSTATAQPTNIGFATRKSLFRQPAGLAVGLALKEPAPPADSPRDSPRELGPPLRGFGNPRIRRHGNIHTTVA